MSEQTARAVSLKSQRAAGQEEIPEGLPEWLEDIQGSGCSRRAKEEPLGCRAWRLCFSRKYGLCRDQGTRQEPPGRIPGQTRAPKGDGTATAVWLDHKDLCHM